MAESISGANLSEIDLEIQRLKRQLEIDDLEGHTCDQCKSLRIPPLPAATSGFEAIPFFEFDTNVKQIRDELAVAGCQFWKTIQDLLTFVSLEGKFHVRPEHKSTLKPQSPGDTP